MKQLRVLMASAEELVEPIFRKAIEEGSHHLTILNPYEKKGEFLAEAKSGGYKESYRGEKRRVPDG